MKEYIALDSHKRYSWVEREEVETGRVRQCRLLHTRGSISEFLGGCLPGTPVAIEATANWYWIIDEMERTGHRPHQELAADRFFCRTGL